MPGRASRGDAHRVAGAEVADQPLGNADLDPDRVDIDEAEGGRAGAEHIAHLDMAQGDGAGEGGPEGGVAELLAGDVALRLGLREGQLGGAEGGFVDAPRLEEGLGALKLPGLELQAGHRQVVGRAQHLGLRFQEDLTGDDPIALVEEHARHAAAAHQAEIGLAIGHHHGGQRDVLDEGRGHHGVDLDIGHLAGWRLILGLARGAALDRDQGGQAQQAQKLLHGGDSFRLLPGFEQPEALLEGEVGDGAVVEGAGQIGAGDLQGELDVEHLELGGLAVGVQVLGDVGR
ncbi:MAG: hypothetical protein ABIL09_03280, partial [Gemmatimonadota bacterium]